jgi:predicted signal transduction protein with EAL and GGDEF domain
MGSGPPLDGAPDLPVGSSSSDRKAGRHREPDPSSSVRLDDPGRLAVVRDYLTLSDESEVAFDELVELAAVVCEAPMALVSLVDDRAQWIQGGVGLGDLGAQEQRLPVADTMCGHVVMTGCPVVLPDASLDDRFADVEMVAGSAHIRFYVGIPLLAPSGHVVGALSAMDVLPREVDPSVLGILERLSRRAVEALELRLRTRDLELERQVLRSTGEVLGLITAGSGLTEVLDSIAHAVEEQDPEAVCAITLVDRDVLVDVAAPSMPKEFRRVLDQVPVGDALGPYPDRATPAGFVVASDIEADPRWTGVRGIAEEAGFRSRWCAPILETDGTVLGTFSLYFTSVRTPEERHLAVIRRWADLTSVAITRTRAQEQIRRMALTDPLTGLPNRAGMHVAYLSLTDLLAEESSSRQVTVLLMDLDRFKIVNDSLGHTVGDEYLGEVAERISCAAGPESVVCRFGGDEFVVLSLSEGEGAEPGSSAGSSSAAVRPAIPLPRISHEGSQGVQTLAQRCLEAVREPVHIRGRNIVLSASVGVATAEEVGVGVTTVLRNADAALYRAKAEGRDRFVVFDTDMHDRAVRDLQLEEDLREAINRGRLSLSFQPNVALTDGRLVGVEALARWKHPVHGSIPPTEFVPVAEESGLIHPLGRWVLRTALRKVGDRRADPAWSRVMVWVNVSAAEFGPDLVDNVSKALWDSGVESSRLGLEVTESSLMQDVPMARAILRELRSAGIRIAVDDFGTGYSNLSQLKHLPVDVLKIDRSFVDGLGLDRVDDGVVEAVLALAKAHQLMVVAEGVERQEQWDRLRELGCDHAQGFLFGLPGSLDEVLTGVAVGLASTVPGKPTTRP